MRFLGLAVPPVSLLLITLIAVAPWGLPADARYILPLLPAIVVHYWALRHPHAMPEWLAFASGLTVDLVTNGPLGFWALMYLLVYIAAILSRPWWDTGPIGRFVLFAAALVGVAVAAFLVSTIYTAALAPVVPLAQATLVALLAYPILAAALKPLDVRRMVRGNDTLSRGV